MHEKIQERARLFKTVFERVVGFETTEEHMYRLNHFSETVVNSSTQAFLEMRRRFLMGDIDEARLKTELTKWRADLKDPATKSARLAETYIEILDLGH